jgi:hypothetical protein
LLTWSASTVAEDQALTDDKVVMRTEGAPRLLLPKDWPVEEEEDGRIVPASLVEYLSMKFDQVAATFDRVTQRLDALERRLQKLEEDQKTAHLRLRWLEQAERDSTHEEGR